MSETAKLKIDDQEIDIPVKVGTENERGLSIARLRAETGLITLDEGYVNTGSVCSGITYLDGEAGVLRYRGYPIEDIAAHCDFVETSCRTSYVMLLTTSAESKQTNHVVIWTNLKSFSGRYVT